MAVKVVIYSTPVCPYCNEIKSYFEKNGVNFEEKNVATNREALIEMKNISGQLGVPVVVIGDEVLKGYDKKKMASLLGLENG